jgi:serine/threonine-protein kinase
VEGTVLAGRYQLTQKLGQGGMGSVWRAQHLALGTPVAIKIIDSSIAQSAEALARFKREAQAAAELRSAHVVQIFDFGVDGNTPFIAMEMLDGESLAGRLETVKQLPPPQVATILTQVARALARAHQSGIVHRDLKPDNIFLVRESGEDLVKVLDFGIAKKLGVLSGDSGVRTSTGAMLGTPYYMSPEQALGKGTIDHRTDIWSLGIIAYECLLGWRPFDSDTLGSLLMAICSEPVPVPSTVAAVPAGFDAWFARAAARDPAQRFASALEATTELTRVCAQPLAPRTSVAPVSPDATTRNGRVSAASIGAHTASPSSVTLHQPEPARGARGWLIGGIALALLAGMGVTWLALKNSPNQVTAPATSETAPVVMAVASAANQPVAASVGVVAANPIVPTPSVSPAASAAAISLTAAPANAPREADAKEAITRGPGKRASNQKSAADNEAKGQAQPTVAADKPQPAAKPDAPANKPEAPAAPQRRDYTQTIGF